MTTIDGTTTTKTLRAEAIAASGCTDPKQIDVFARGWDAGWLGGTATGGRRTDSEWPIWLAGEAAGLADNHARPTIMSLADELLVPLGDVYAIADDAWCEHGMRVLDLPGGRTTPNHRLSPEAAADVRRQYGTVGLAEIADRLGVARQTVDGWRAGRVVTPLPEPLAGTVGGDPAWDWGDIAAWAKATGRWPY